MKKGMAPSRRNKKNLGAEKGIKDKQSAEDKTCGPRRSGRRKERMAKDIILEKKKNPNGGGGREERNKSIPETELQDLG